jgi:hypothetical protein
MAVATSIMAVATSITTINDVAEGSRAFQETSKRLPAALFTVRPPLKGGRDWISQYDLD